jgi:hypothetical protein
MFTMTEVSEEDMHLRLVPKSNNSTVMLYDGTLTNVEDLVQGFGLKGSPISTPITADMIEFIVFAHGLGEMKKVGKKKISRKINPEKAISLQRKVNTSGGQLLYPDQTYMKVSESGFPKFQMQHIFNRFQIKSYFSKVHADLQKLLTSYRRKAPNAMIEEMDGNED